MNAAIHDIIVIATGKDVPSNVPGVTRPTINGQAAVASALKTLLDDGIVTPLQAPSATSLSSPPARTFQGTYPARRRQRSTDKQLLPARLKRCWTTGL
jgi:hypothetical protein